MLSKVTRGKMNKSNFHPLNEELIIWIDKPLEGFTLTDKGDYKKGYLIHTYESIEHAAFKETTGVVVEMGENVFPNITKAPKVGERVVFKPYAGMNIYGDDKQFYRILTWKEIRAIYQSK